MFANLKYKHMIELCHESKGVKKTMYKTNRSHLSVCVLLMHGGCQRDIKSVAIYLVPRVIPTNRFLVIFLQNKISCQ